MKRLSLITLLLAMCIFATGTADIEITYGKIDMNLPNGPAPLIEVNLDKTFFSLFISFTMNLPEYAEYAEMIEGVYVRSYDKTSEELTDIINHYQDNLKTGNWEHLVKVKDKLHVSLLFADAPGVVNGIFISFTDKHNTTFVNICGNIDFQKIGILVGKIMESEPDFLKDIKFDGKFGN